MNDLRITPAVVRLCAAVLDHDARRERIFGYELGRAAQVRPGVMYPFLRRAYSFGWFTDGWLCEHPAADDRSPRRYYNLTPAGRTALVLIVHQYGPIRLDHRPWWIVAAAVVAVTLLVALAIAATHIGGAR